MKAINAYTQIYGDIDGQEILKKILQYAISLF